MALISTVILYLTALIFPFGQLLRINIYNINFPVIDICIGLLALINLFIRYKNHDLIVKNKPFLNFLVFALITFVINYFRIRSFTLPPLLYLFRLIALISFFIWPVKFKDNRFALLFSIGIVSNLIFGFIQYFFWPNFTYFDSQNWDPHLFRLVSSFFDPTFTALIYLMFIVYLFLKPKISYRWPLITISYLAMALTYSRSSFIAFLVVFSFIAYKMKNIKIFIISFIVISSTIFLLPRQTGEGTKLERTSSIMAKVENYKEAIKVFNKAPIIGHGYNKLALVRQIKINNSHANNGFDSSLMTVLTTTGIIGLFLFVFGLKKYYSYSDLTHQSLLIGILVHSLFANSLLYPWVLLFLVFI